MKLIAAMHLSILFFIASHIQSFEANNSVVLELHRRSVSVTNITEYDSMSLLPNYDPNRKTRIYLHGRASKSTIVNYRKSLLEADDSNVIIVHWRNGANAIYYSGSKIPTEDVSKRFYSRRKRNCLYFPNLHFSIKKVTNKLTGLIDTLVANGMNLKDLTIIGHGIGMNFNDCIR